MEIVTQWKELIFKAIAAMSEKLMLTLPNIFGALVVLLLGWVLIRLSIFLLKKVFKLIKLDKLTEKINELGVFEKTNIDIKVSKVIITFVKWIMFLVLLIIAADIMQWDVVSKEIGNLLRYLPRLFSAMALFMIGIYIATFVKNAIHGLYKSFNLNGAKIISSLVFYIIAIIITITALNQAGIDTTVIINNVTIILGAFLLAISIGLGLGSWMIVADLLRTFYMRKNFEVGDRIKINEVEGTVLAVDNLCVTLETSTGKMIIPIKTSSESTITVMK